ncbi:MAG TPA: glycerol kinase GlpK [Gemmatimonadota bacterium]|nr:glycerol kinase GlpK [Gemmatimonadota bacterium]
MTAPARVLAIDQGTTSTRAILFDERARPLVTAQTRLPQSYPHSGWVEHDPERIFEDTVDVCREALERAGAGPEELAAIGITNQRETTVLWERATGRPVHPAIVWQDRRTASLCETLREQGAEALVRERTGLLLDPYFSGTKLAWLLEHVDGAREAAGRGELAFGTIDAWLLWRLTGGEVHATDATNASRTLLFDIHRQRWDEKLLDLLGVPAAVLPEVRDSAGSFGDTEASVLGRPVPILGVAGDQQAATFGQAAFREGAAKCTYGTGAFLLQNTGREAVLSENRLLTTVAWRLEGEVTYALEGSIFSAGSAVDWLRDGPGIVEEVSRIDELAGEARDESEAVLVPAFTGLGAPHWDPGARGALLGLTRDTGRAEIARAALEAVGFQTLDLLEAMEGDAGLLPDVLRVDGGLSRSDLAMSFLADILAVPVERPAVSETTALGAACLAGLAAGTYGSLEELEARWTLDRRWEPGMSAQERGARVERWRRAVRRVLTG